MKNHFISCSEAYALSARILSGDRLAGRDARNPFAIRYSPFVIRGHWPRPMAALACFLTIALPMAGGLAASAQTIDPHNPPQGRFSDEWAEIHLAGTKVGYMHTSMTRRGDEIETKNVTKMRLGRVESPVEISTQQTTRESLAGRPITFTTQMDAATMRTTTRGTIRAGKIEVVTSQYGMEQTRSFDFSPTALMAWGMYRESLIRGFKPGTEYTIDAYAPELRLDAPVQAVTSVGDWESFDKNGKQQRGQKVVVVMKSPVGELTMTSWVDKEGLPLKAVIPAPGLGDMVMYAVDQATALADFVPPEVFLKTTVPAGRRLHRQSLKRLVCRIRPLNAEVDLSGLPTTPMQKVEDAADDAITVTLTRQTYKPQSKETVRPSDMSEYLESNLMMNTADPELIKLAKRAAGGKTEPFALANQLRKFVNWHVRSKNLTVGFATASEVCRTREGDCSEHGVLLAALGRINNIPSRVAVGIAYVPSMGGQRDIFGYHLWTQFYLDGRWLDYDAAINEEHCSPTRIAFATSSLRNTGLADLSLPLLSKIGAIDIEILEVNEGGKSD